MKIQKNILQISASNMREALMLNVISKISDGEGGYTTTTTASKTIMAAVDEQKGSRILELNAITFDKVYKVYCRYDEAIVNGSSFTYKGKLLIIHSINNLSQLNRYFEILTYTNA